MIENILRITAIVMAVLAIVGVGLVLFGFRPFILESTSMEPLYQKGSLVWAYTRIKPDDLEIGDVVVYRANKSMIVLHRVVGDGLLQGDANDEAQQVTLTPANLIGREAFTMPHLGSLNSKVLAIPIVVYVVVIILFILGCAIKPTKESEKAK